MFLPSVSVSSLSHSLVFGEVVFDVRDYMKL